MGCNTGDLTNKIFSEIIQLDRYALGYGVDVDQALICRAKFRFPQIKFHTCDASSSSFIKDIQSWSRHERFDLVTCFGTTMWIHIHHGDEGLATFLRSLTKLSSSYLILEPQPSKCYRHARKRMRKSKITIPEAMNKIQWRGDKMIYENIDRTLSNAGFALVKNLGNTKWKRRILLYFRSTV